MEKEVRPYVKRAIPDSHIFQNTFIKRYPLMSQIDILCISLHRPFIFDRQAVFTLPHLIHNCERVYSLSSLTIFECLLRNKVETETLRKLIPWIVVIQSIFSKSKTRILISNNLLIECIGQTPNANIETAVQNLTQVGLTLNINCLSSRLIDQINAKLDAITFKIQSALIVTNFEGVQMVREFKSFSGSEEFWPVQDKSSFAQLQKQFGLKQIKIEKVVQFKAIELQADTDWALQQITILSSNGQLKPVDIEVTEKFICKEPKIEAPIIEAPVASKLRLTSMDECVDHTVIDIKQDETEQFHIKIVEQQKIAESQIIISKAKQEQAKLEQAAKAERESISSIQEQSQATKSEASDDPDNIMLQAIQRSKTTKKPKIKNNKLPKQNTIMCDIMSEFTGDEFEVAEVKSEIIAPPRFVPPKIPKKDSKAALNKYQFGKEPIIMKKPPQININSIAPVIIKKRQEFYDTDDVDQVDNEKVEKQRLDKIEANESQSLKITITQSNSNPIKEAHLSILQPQPIKQTARIIDSNRLKMYLVISEKIPRVCQMQNNQLVQVDPYQNPEISIKDNETLPKVIAQHESSTTFKFNMAKPLQSNQIYSFITNQYKYHLQSRIFKANTQNSSNSNTIKAIIDVYDTLKQIKSYTAFPMAAVEQRNNAVSIKNEKWIQSFRLRNFETINDDLRQHQTNKLSRQLIRYWQFAPQNSISSSKYSQVTVFDQQQLHNSDLQSVFICLDQAHAKMQEIVNYYQ